MHIILIGLVIVAGAFGVALIIVLIAVKIDRKRQAKKAWQEKYERMRRIYGPGLYRISPTGDRMRDSYIIGGDEDGQDDREA